MKTLVISAAAFGQAALGNRRGLDSLEGKDAYAQSVLQGLAALEP